MNIEEISTNERPLTAEERKAQREAERERIKKRFQGIDQSLIEAVPADEQPNFFDDTSEKRVCAYNRVSTDNLQQTSSIELQQVTNVQTIEEHPGWHLVKVYTDEGISGTSITHRKGFQEMIADCEAGLIDVIIVKSVSRFARNLVDCVEIVRKLKYARHPVGVFFETEHIYSLDPNSEMFLNIMAMLAQSESQNKSDIMNDSIEKRFRMGIFLTPVLLGYDKDKEGSLVINEDEAKTVKLMYYMMLAGSNTIAIAKTLTDLGRKTKLGNIKWSSSGVAATMRNERYCGEVLARKTYTPNCLDHKAKKNKRNRNQYRMADHHEPIVSPVQWRAVQKILDSRKYGFEGGYLPISVIETGALKGFVSVNRAWAGANLEDYFAASRKAYGGDLPQYVSDQETEASNEICAKDTPSINRNAFQVADRNLFSRVGEPFLGITSNKLKFAQSCFERLGGTTHIEILLNPVERLLAIRTCDENHPNAIRWVNGKNKTRDFGSTGFSGMIYSLMNWSENCRYNMPAIIRHRDDERIMFFDLDEPIIKLKKVESKLDTADETTEESTDFGTPLIIHKNQTRVPTIDIQGEWNIGAASSVIENTEELSPDVSSVFSDISKNK